MAAFSWKPAAGVPFAAEQYFTIDPPGFLWKATFRIAPLVSVTGRDRYRAGEASMERRVLSLAPVRRRWTPDRINRCPLQRCARNERWVNRYDADKEFGGIRVPPSGEARWEYESGPYPYIQWRITTIEQDRLSRFARKANPPVVSFPRSLSVSTNLP